MLLLELSAHGGFAVAGLAHFNHQLRPTADRDEEFCRDLAHALGLEFRVERADVAAYARCAAVFRSRMRPVGSDTPSSSAPPPTWSADRIAVGHTLDDQAETVLLKLIRGAGLTGLGGISPRKGDVVRPLLEVTKRDLTAYLSGGRRRLGRGRDQRRPVESAEPAPPRRPARAGARPIRGPRRAIARAGGAGPDRRGVARCQAPRRCFDAVARQTAESALRTGRGTADYGAAAHRPTCTADGSACSCRQP